MDVSIGIDMSKDKLDAYWLSKREHKLLCNDKAEIKTLALWAKEAGVSRVIFDPTAIYHRGGETELADHDIIFVRANPRPGHGAFANGQLAKTDRVPCRAFSTKLHCGSRNAAMLARMGSLLQLQTNPQNMTCGHDPPLALSTHNAPFKPDGP